MLLQRIYSDFGKSELALQSSRCVVSCLKVLELGETYKYQNKFIHVCTCPKIQLYVYLYYNVVQLYAYSMHDLVGMFATMHTGPCTLY